MRRFITLVLIALLLISCGQPVEWKTATVVEFSEPISGVQIGSYVWVVSFDNGETYYIEESKYKQFGPMSKGYRYDYRKGTALCDCREYPFIGAYHESMTGR
jgi:uncharacterized protein YcfL